MQSKLALVSKLNRMILFATPKYRRSPFASAGDNETEGDDAMTQGVDTANPKPNDKNTPTREDNHYMRPKTVPSSSKLQTPGVNTPIDPHVQQKRSKTMKPEEELTCAGSPWPEGTGREEQEEDDKEYFKHHKASPLSEIEIADTRKPLEKVMHGTSNGDEKVLTWTPEQLDTAEQSLLRATEMFREAAARGVPEWPHSRRLRQLRGEDW